MGQGLSLGGHALRVGEVGGPGFGHVLDRHDDLQVELLRDPRIDDLALPLRPHEELRNPLQRPLRRREPDALDALDRARGSGEGSTEPPRCCSAESSPRLPDQVIESLQRQRQVGPPLGLGDRVDLVDDHRLGRGEDLADAGGEHQVERLGGGDEDVGRGFFHRPPFGLARVAGPQPDRDVGADPRQRRPQVALDVVGERLQRRDVDEPHPGCRSCRLARRGGRSPRGSWRGSCRSRSGRRSACWRRSRSPSSHPPGRASAPRRRPRTSAGPGR